MKVERGLALDDVLMVPKNTSLSSRSDVDVSTQITPDVELDIPILSAAMDTVTGGVMADEMERLGGVGVVHRFMPDFDRIECTHGRLMYSHAPRALAIGLDDDLDFLYDVVEAAEGIETVLVLDVANGHMRDVAEKIEEIRGYPPVNRRVSVVAGNVATKYGAAQIIEAGADAVKVGIGPGSACTTRIKTGCGVPQFSAIADVANLMERYDDRFLIADGGVKNGGDLAKCIAAGADAVMIGGLFAGTDESPDGVNHRGMASKEAAEENNKNLYTAEGISMEAEDKGPVEDVVEDLIGGLRSAMTYTDSPTIQDLKQHERFTMVSPNGVREAHPRRV